MKIVTLLGSPRSRGNSAAIAKHFNDAATGRGAAVRTFELNRLTYRGCQGCYACKKTLDHCVLQDDLAEVLNAVREADLLVMATPVYFGDVTSQLKGFIDRTYSYLKPDYIANPQPSRLGPKKLLMILTQGHRDATLFGDIYTRYDNFFKWMGFMESRLIRICGIGPASVDAVPADILKQAEDAANQWVE